MTEVQAATCQFVAEAIGCPLARVAPESNLFELGAQSLEFLDVVFKLEQEYGIEITRGEMERAAKGDMSDDQFAPDGLISPAGLERLRTLMPEASARIVPGLRPEEILTLFTVQTFVNIVEGKRAGASVPS